MENARSRGLGSITAWEWTALAAVLAAAAVLVLADLDDPYLWQDEAQTALVAGSILEHGIPLGRDARGNSFSQEAGVELGEGNVWKWHTWLSFYACALSLALLGETTTAARLPFALFGLATVALTWAAGRRLFGDRRAALLAAGLLALSVPSLLLARQARYYPMAAFFSLWALVAYTGVRRGERRGGVALVAAATLLFHTHYVYAGTLLLSCLLHAWGFARERLVPTLWAAGAVALLNAPWIAWFATTRYGERYTDRVLDPGLSLLVGGRLAGLWAEHLLTPVVAGVAVLLWAAPAVLRWPAPAPRPEERRSAALLLVFCAVNVAALAVAAPGGYFRYLAPLAPPAALLGGALAAALWRRSRAAAGLALAAWLAQGQLPDLAYELRHDYDGPVEGIVRTLQRYGTEDEVVLVNYGDLPIKYYTDLRVVGGLTDEDLRPAARADWIILRKDAVGAEHDARIRAFARSLLRSGAYTGRTIDYPDVPFENREDPELHRFRTAPDNVPRVRIYHRRDR